MTCRGPPMDTPRSAVRKRPLFRRTQEPSGGACDRSRPTVAARSAYSMPGPRVQGVAMYGRSDEAWEQLTDAGLKFLVERAQLHKVTTYTEMNSVLARRTGLPGFDFEQADERAAMGYLLGLIVERDYPKSGFMISALVHYLGANDAGPGFYT